MEQDRLTETVVAREEIYYGQILHVQKWTVELPDGSLLTVYYQIAAGDRFCSLHWTRWDL